MSEIVNQIIIGIQMGSIYALVNFRIYNGVWNNKINKFCSW